MSPKGGMPDRSVFTRSGQGKKPRSRSGSRGAVGFNKGREATCCVLAQTAYSLGHLLTSILAASKEMCWYACAVVMGRESKQIWQDGTSLMWARNWLTASAPKLARFGILRPMRDPMSVSAMIELNQRNSSIKRLILNRAAPLAGGFLSALRALLLPQHVSIILDKI